MATKKKRARRKVVKIRIPSFGADERAVLEAYRNATEAGQAASSEHVIGLDPSFLD